MFTTSVNNTVNWTINRMHNSGNKFEVKIDSQYPIINAFIQKAKHNQLYFESQFGILNETPSIVSDFKF